MEVLTYNTKLLANNETKERAKAMIDSIANVDCDVVLLQEVYKKKFKNILLKGTVQPPEVQLEEGVEVELPEREGGLINKHQYHFFEAKGGLLTISKWPIETSELYNFSRENNPGGRRRGFIYAVINKRGKYYHVFNTHLMWDKKSALREVSRDIFPDADFLDVLERSKGEIYREFQEVRKQQLIEMNEFIKERNIPDGEPVILGGDFNFGGPDDPDHEKYSSTSDPIEGYFEFKDDILKVKDLYPRILYKCAAEAEERVLDHVFYRNVQFNHCLSFIEELTFEADNIDWKNNPNLSDHPPYKAHFEL